MSLRSIRTAADVVARRGVIADHPQVAASHSLTATYIGSLTPDYLRVVADRHAVAGIGVVVVVSAFLYPGVNAVCRAEETHSPHEQVFAVAA